MKKFRFSLEKVLEYRSQIEDARLSAFSKAVEVFERRRKDIERIGEEIGVYKARLAEMGVGRISSRELAGCRSYLSHCEMEFRRAQDWLDEAARAVEAKRGELIAAQKDRRLIEKFKEIKRRHYDYEAEREAIKELDEIAARGFLVRQAAAGGVE
jgi:flagellar FliJ protein